MDDTAKNKAIERLSENLLVDKQKAEDLLEDAVVIVLDYTNREAMVDELWIYARQLATIAFNMQGDEGEISRSEGGVSRTFVTDIPTNIQRGLNRYRVGKVVSYYATKDA